MSLGQKKNAREKKIVQGKEERRKPGSETCYVGRGVGRGGCEGTRRWGREETSPTLSDVQ